MTAKREEYSYPFWWDIAEPIERVVSILLTIAVAALTLGLVAFLPGAWAMNVASSWDRRRYEHEHAFKYRTDARYRQDVDTGRVEVRSWPRTF